MDSAEKESPIATATAEKTEKKNSVKDSAEKESPAERASPIATATTEKSYSVKDSTERAKHITTATTANSSAIPVADTATESSITTANSSAAWGTAFTSSNAHSFERDVKPKATMAWPRKANTGENPLKDDVAKAVAEKKEEDDKKGVTTPPHNLDGSFEHDVKPKTTKAQPREAAASTKPKAHTHPFPMQAQPQQQDLTSIKRRIMNELFPEKLYRMLEELEAEGMDDIISFVNDGTVLKIHKREAFEQQVIPRYFRQKRGLASFKRQLWHYGFVQNRATSGLEFYHKLFQRGQPELCFLMKRIYKKARPTSPVVDSRFSPSVTAGPAMADAAAPDNIKIMANDESKTFAGVSPTAETKAEEIPLKDDVAKAVAEEKEEDKNAVTTLLLKPSKGTASTKRTTKKATASTKRTAKKVTASTKPKTPLSPNARRKLSKKLSKTRHRPEVVPDMYLFTKEKPLPGMDSCLLKGPSVEWMPGATKATKTIFEKDMAIGHLEGAEAVAADFANDVMKYQDWIRFSSSGRIATSNGGNSLGSIFDCRNQWPSLENVMLLIDEYQDSSPKRTPPKGWIQGNGSISSPGVSMTHSKHHDRQHRWEVFMENTFGVEKNRVRIAITMNEPSGVHKGYTKETRYAYKGQDILIIYGKIYSFTIMGARANGKKGLFESTLKTHDGDNEDIPCLGEDYTFPDEEEDGDDTSGRAKHGVYYNAFAFSAMFELTIQEGRVYEFCNALSNCYKDYKPTHQPGTVSLIFPSAKKSYQEAKVEEKRLLAAKEFEQGPLRLIEAFVKERGHGAISPKTDFGKPIDSGLLFLANKLRWQKRRGMNPHIAEMLQGVGFVFNIELWWAERTIGLMEEYCRDGADINSIGKDYVTKEGFQLGYRVYWMYYNWRKNKKLPELWDTPEIKERLDRMGYDFGNRYYRKHPYFQGDTAEDKMEISVTEPTNAPAVSTVDGLGVPIDGRFDNPGCSLDEALGCEPGLEFWQNFEVLDQSKGQSCFRRILEH